MSAAGELAGVAEGLCGLAELNPKLATHSYSVVLSAVASLGQLLACPSCDNPQLCCYQSFMTLTLTLTQLCCYQSFMQLLTWWCS